jgi:hypothetical protein
VNRCKSGQLVLTLLACLGTSSVAIAGELGSTSRGTVSISITIPPHVTATAASADGGEGKGGLCLRSNGFKSYHVALLDGAEPLRSSISFSDDPTAPGSKQLPCAASGVAREASRLIVGRESAARTSVDRPLTLLIVPD